MPLRVYTQFIEHFSDAQQFLRLLLTLDRLRPVVLQSSPGCENGPHHLPVSVTAYLADTLRLSPTLLASIWTELRPFFPELVNLDLTADVDNDFRLHGRSHGLGAENAYPPNKTCIRAECSAQGRLLLQEDRGVECRLFTLHRGIVPLWSHSLYCRSCNTRYYPNYFVHQAQQTNSIRQYYETEDIPSHIQVREHSYVEAELCCSIRYQMSIGQMSATRIASIYNSLLPSSNDGEHSRLKIALDYNIIFDSFYLYSLLLDHQTHRESDKYHSPFVIPHQGEQAHRFDRAMEERNLRFAHNSRKAWSHACDDCFKVSDLQDGRKVYQSAIVTDGVTIGHPCCAREHCQEDLAHGRDRHCPTHSQENVICAVAGCTEPASSRFVTCEDPIHRTWEESRRQKRETYRVLRRRHQTAWSTSTKPSQPSDSSSPIPDPPPPPLTAGADADEDEDEDDPALPPVLILRGRIYRQWTHNEQLVVCPCGIIKARTAFFTAEGQHSVCEFLRAVFPPDLPGALPSYIFYDNACQVLIHLQSIGDHYFDNSALVVDVFHSYEKHKADHAFCQKYCNPAGFPDLRTSDGKWEFNTSAAEQVNNWYGAFQPLVREMTRVKYEFYLDEMIEMRNEQTTARLEETGKHPYNIPLEHFLEPISRCTLDQLTAFPLSHVV